MKRINSLLLLFIIDFLLLQACKKDKEDPPPPPPDPIALYTFDNDWAKNSMSELLHGAVVGDLSSTTDSFNTDYAAFLFSGNGYVKVTDSDLLDFPGGQFTLVAWIRPSKISGTYVVHKSANSGGGGAYSLDIHPGFVRGNLRTTTDEFFSVTGTTKIVKDVWQHIAVTFTGEQLTIYYNGEAEGNKAVDRPLMVTTGDLSIGTYEYAFPGASFEGKLDNVRLYDKALSAGQIMDLYQHYKQ
jgi:hypothetical protein